MQRRSVLAGIIVFMIVVVSLLFVLASIYGWDFQPYADFNIAIVGAITTVIVILVCCLGPMLVGSAAVVATTEIAQELPDQNEIVYRTDAGEIKTLQCDRVMTDESGLTCFINRDDENLL